MLFQLARQMKLLSLSITAAACTLITLTAFSHSGATGVVKERMDAMSNMADATKRVADMYKGKSEFNEQAIADAISSYLRHGDEMRTLFPDTKNSRAGSDTEALPQIWATPEKFTEQIDAFVDASKTLNTLFNASANIDAANKQLKKQFFVTTKTCSNCHKLFRKPKE